MQATDKPVAVGFGISRPEHVKQVLNLTQSFPKASYVVFIIASRMTGSVVWTDSWMGSWWSDRRQCDGEAIGGSKVANGRAQGAWESHQVSQICSSLNTQKTFEDNIVRLCFVSASYNQCVTMMCQSFDHFKYDSSYAQIQINYLPESYIWNICPFFFCDKCFKKKAPNHLHSSCNAHRSNKWRTVHISLTT